MLLAEGLERRILDLDQQEDRLEGKPSLAEVLDAAALSNYAGGSKEAAEASAKIGAKLAAYHKAAIPITLARTILALRLQTYRETGVLPDSPPDIERLTAFIEQPWKSEPGDGTKGCLVLDRCSPTPSLELGLPELIRQLDRYNAHDAMPMVRHIPAPRSRSLVITRTETKPVAARVKVKADPVAYLISSLSSSDPRRRALAADSLASLGLSASSAVPALRQALYDADPRVRASAALALGGVAAALPEIIEDLQRTLLDPNEDVRLSSRTALGRLASR